MHPHFACSSKTLENSIPHLRIRLALRSVPGARISADHLRTGVSGAGKPGASALSWSRSQGHLSRAGSLLWDLKLSIVSFARRLNGKVG
jgi:hypothetical protein